MLDDKIIDSKLYTATLDFYKYSSTFFLKEGDKNKAKEYKQKYESYKNDLVKEGIDVTQH